MTPAQCRAARALLDWTQADLAARTSISAVSIRGFEKGGDMRDSNRKLVRLTLEAAGVYFLECGDASRGPGVSLTSLGEG